ncbi:MAG: hypothetical protein JWN94_4121 [Betaproteobacteria bacterium]|nr:hypothetical protein [Betaproteobacteria bacterium]
MSEENPYQMPGSPAAPVVAAPAASSTSPRPVDAGRGWDWIADAFALFKKQPGTWILILIVAVVCAMLLAMVPVIGALANFLLMQIFMGGLMLGCRALANNEPFELAHLFAGFKHNTGDLVVLGVLALAGWVVSMIPAIAIMGFGAFMALLMGSTPAAHIGGMGLSILLALLVMLALAIPLYMALWFSPALVALNNLKPVEAMKASFIGCLKNIVPFLVYSVIMMVFCIVAAIPLGLGFLVLGPVWVASVYTSYRDIFTVP